MSLRLSPLALLFACATTDPTTSGHPDPLDDAEEEVTTAIFAATVVSSRGSGIRSGEICIEGACVPFTDGVAAIEVPDGSELDISIRGKGFIEHHVQVYMDGDMDTDVQVATHGEMVLLLSELGLTGGGHRIRRSVRVLDQRGAGPAHPDLRRLHPGLGLLLGRARRRDRGRGVVPRHPGPPRHRLRSARRRRAPALGLAGADSDRVRLLLLIRVREDQHPRVLPRGSGPPTC